MEHAPTMLEFSRPFEVETLGQEPRRLSLEADSGERAALARRFSLQGLAALSADFTLTQLGGGMIEVSGRIRAQATQTCVVTLEPVATAVDERFSLVYAPGADVNVPEEVDVDPDAADPPEPIVGGVIDLGEVAAEQLSLALDPYPRKPGARFDAEALGVSDGGRSSPFAALGALKPRA